MYHLTIFTTFLETYFSFILKNIMFAILISHGQAMFGDLTHFQSKLAAQSHNPSIWCVIAY